MAFYQVPQGRGAFTQVHPENGGFSQLHDRNNPQAQAYARMALARNGIHVPPGADAAALWRQFSQQRMLQRNAASFQGPDAPDAGGIAPGGAGPQQPGTPIQGGTDPGQQSGLPMPGIHEIANRLPEGGYRGGPDVLPQLPGPLGPDSVDWKTRIQQMAAAMGPGNTVHRVANVGTEFQHQQGGPAEGVLAMRRLHAVNQAHSAARNLARLLSARKPSNTFRRTHDPRAY